MPEALHVASGKVREIYALGDDRLLLVASDRISTFDVVLPSEIPDKGRVLTGLSAFWFARTRHIVGNHLLKLRDDARSVECLRLEMLPDGTASVSGSIGALSGRAMVGSVVVRGEPGRLVQIGRPASIALYGIGGGSIRLDSLVTDLPAQPRLDSQGTLQFRFGGALHVEGGVDGDYRGDVPITVDYL